MRAPKEILEAWVAGKKIKVYLQHVDRTGEWIDWKHDYSPFLSPAYTDFRIKPEPKPDIVLYRNIYNGVGISPFRAKNFSSFEEAEVHGMRGSLGIEKITIDGETGKLKSIEIVKEYLCVNV